MKKEIILGTIIDVILVVISFLVVIAIVAAWIVGIVFLSNMLINGNFSYVKHFAPIGIFLVVFSSFIKPIRLISSYFLMMWSSCTTLGALYYMWNGDISVMTVSLFLSSLVLLVIETKRAFKLTEDMKVNEGNKAVK